MEQYDNRALPGEASPAALTGTMSEEEKTFLPHPPPSPPEACRSVFLSDSISSRA